MVNVSQLIIIGSVRTAVTVNEEKAFPPHVFIRYARSTTVRKRKSSTCFTAQYAHSMMVAFLLAHGQCNHGYEPLEEGLSAYATETRGPQNQTSRGKATCCALEDEPSPIHLRLVKTHLGATHNATLGAIVW
ncbi:hypothetical protein ZHAS_00021499 [Anopheles sinensis]|uniref:Uncharacterized protein n=1 Tax=Anopheles sinensis TaxID=74873 RepID=A0A084WSK0_ANOSI|nr:hypothetical protein ZHAS_00021499 [Anopheles sinensis]